MGLFLYSIFIIFCVWSSFPHELGINASSQTANMMNHNEIEKAIEDYMSFDLSKLEQTSDEIGTSTSNGESIAIPIFDTYLFIKSDYKDYKSLVLSRLERDMERAKWLSSVVRRRRKPSSSGPLIYVDYFGNQTTYVAEVKIGTPPQIARLLVDMGSVIVWWKCKPCRNVKSCPSSTYDPSRSSSYRETYCWTDASCATEFGFPYCDSSSRCKFNVTYMEDSASGYLAYEKIATANSLAWTKNISQSLKFGCVNAPTQLSSSGAFDGIMGLAPGELSLINQINATSFSLCPRKLLDTYPSALYFNKDITTVNGSISFPLIPNRSLYTVGFQGMTVGDEFVPIFWAVFAREAIIDTGCSFTLFEPSFYRKFRDSFVSQSVNATFHTSWIFDTCVNDLESPHAQFPTISFKMIDGDRGSRELTLDPDLTT